MAAIKKRYELMEKDNKFEDEMMFKNMVKNEIQDNKKQK